MHHPNIRQRLHAELADTPGESDRACGPVVQRFDSRRLVAVGTNGTEVQVRSDSITGQ
jgi:hypothetical protein